MFEEIRTFGFLPKSSWCAGRRGEIGGNPVLGRAMIVVENLIKSFSDLRRGQVLAVDGVSFTAHPGEIFGLLGPNGAGKTTALRVLSTVLRPTSGRVRVAGFDVVEQPEQVRRRIGFMSAGTGVYDRMTAWEMVEYFGRLYAMTDDVLARRMEVIFETLQMNEIRDVLGSKMSTGMRQKVSIARTIVHDPPVLIFDEPTTGLDVLVARAMLQSVKDLREQGKCIVFSTHVMREAEKLCDRIAIVHKGKILASGTLEQLCARYRQDDLEELFFDLITEHDRGWAAEAMAG
jgi:sodium transport system ATP-binding protein